MHLDTYNRHTTNYATAQQVIDEAIIFVNHAVSSMNLDVGFKAPWIQDTIHSLTHGHRYHKYAKLRDGLHPHEETKDVWARLIAKTIIENCKKASTRHD